MTGLTFYLSRVIYCIVRYINETSIRKENKDDTIFATVYTVQKQNNDILFLSKQLKYTLMTFGIKISHDDGYLRFFKLDLSFFSLPLYCLSIYADSWNNTYTMLK